MRPIIAHAKAFLPERAQPQAHRPSRAPARAGRPYPAVNCEIDGAPALFPLNRAASSWRSQLRVNRVGDDRSEPAARVRTSPKADAN